MAEKDQGFLTGALRAFHNGLRMGGGGTETVQAGAGKDRTGGPYFKTLAVAGLGGMLLAATVNPGPAQAAGVEASFLGGLLGTGTVSMSQAETNSPRLKLLSENLGAFTGDTDVLVIDLRDDSPTFGKGASGAMLDTFKRGWGAIQPIAVLMDKSLSPGLVANGDPERQNVCTIILGGPHFTGPVSEKAATIGSVFERHDGGAPKMNEDGGIASSPERIEIRMSDASFDNFVAYHELGHCVDPTFRAESTRDMDVHGKAYQAHLYEAYADAFATLMTVRAEGHTRTAEEMADLRLISTATSGSFKGLAKLTGTLDAPEVASNPGAQYHTTPTIDATLAWIRDVGISRVRSMGPEEITAKAREMVDATKPTPEAFRKFKLDLLDTRMADGRMLLSPDLPEGFVERLNDAMDAVGFRPAAGDAPDIASSKPTWKAKLDAPSVGEVSSLAPVGGIDLGRALGQDLHEGAEVVAMETRGKGVQVQLREADGTTTKVIVSAGGDVMRYGPDGKLSSLSPDRPAVAKADGTVQHRLIVDGEQVEITPDEAYRHFQEMAAGTSTGSPR